MAFPRRQLLQDGDLPFTDILTEEAIAKAWAALTGWLDRVFSPLVTLWVFLGQVLSADHSCRAAVARLIAHRLTRGQNPCSAETEAYCQARKRLPALEGLPRLRLRRVFGHHSGHAGEPGRLPVAGRAEAGLGLSVRLMKPRHEVKRRMRDGFREN